MSGKKLAAIFSFLFFIIAVKAGLGASNGPEQESAEAVSKKSMPELIDGLHSRPDDLFIVDRMKTLKDKSALPELKIAFDKNSIKSNKQRVAIAIVKIGDEDQTFKSYLRGFAEEAIDRDSPNLIDRDSNVKVVRGKFSKDFLNWCKQNGLEPKSTARKVYYEDPADVIALGMTDDPDNLTIFLKGLNSKNDGVVFASICSLARLDDASAIEPIVKVCEAEPASEAAVSAAFLLTFSEDAAWKEAERFFKDKNEYQSLMKMTIAQRRKALLGV